MRKDGTILQRIEKTKYLLISALFLCFMICVFAPYEMIIPNIKSLEMPFVLYAGIPVVVFLLSMLLLLIVIVFVLPQKHYRSVEAIMYAVGITIYVQSNFLGIDLGVLNGDAVDWESYWVRIVINTFSLELIFLIVFLIIWHYREKAERVFGFIVMVMMGAQIFALSFIFVKHWGDVKVQNVDSYYATTKDLFSIGEGETNVVWFLLDMMDDDYMDIISVIDKDIIDKLDGFTNFTNCSGVYPTSDYSAAMYMTGQLFLNEKDLSEWIEDKANEGIWLDEFVDLGYNMNGYSNSEIMQPPIELQNFENGKVYIRNYLRFAIQIYKLVANKYAPDIFKPIVQMDDYGFRYWKGYTSEDSKCVSNNVDFANQIAENEIVVKEGNDFKFIYLDGAHYPYANDSNGERVPNNSVSAIECAEGAMRIVEEYLDKLKESGKYDNTIVVICADHGYYRHGTLTSPTMLIKPKNSHGDMKVNYAPVTQLDFPATILKLAGIENYSDYGISMFDVPEGISRDRFFYSYYLLEGITYRTRRRLIQFKVDSDNNKEFELTNVEYSTDGEIVDHKAGCRTCNGEIRADDWGALRDWKYTIHYKRD